MNGDSLSSAPSAEQTEPKTSNIEVCARVRPLLVDETKNKKFFEVTATSPRSTPRNARPGSRISRLQQIASTRSPRHHNKRKAGIPHDNDTESTASTVDTTDSSIAAWDVIGNDTVQQSPHTDRVQGRTHSYTLDRVYGPDATTKHLYEASVRPVVLSAMDGYHCSVFAYGQTSTGKTHTMSGSKSSPGIVPLAVQDCFNYVEQQCVENREYLLRVSYLEIYNEQIIDLLSDTPVAVRIFETPREGVIIRGLREEVVTSPQEVYNWIQAGETRRQVGSTNMNKHSSRSHAVFRLWIESKASAKSKGNTRARVSSLSLVDLAGSESARLTGSTGERQREGQYINKSLMALGQVVYKLSEVKRRHIEGGGGVHIPYRDSKLTRLLQPSLSGNAQIVVICNISPRVSHIEESHNTLKFAVRAKKIQQRATITEVNDDKTLLQSYREQIADLQNQLEEARQAQRKMEQKKQVEVVGSEDIQDIVEAIEKMERLILKTQTLNQRKLQAEEDMLLLSPDPEPDFLLKKVEEPSKPINETQEGKSILEEMKWVQGLLGSVLTKRQAAGGTVAKVTGTPRTPRTSRTPSTMSFFRGAPSTPARDEEVEALRAQLHEQEVTTSLRKADAKFLQAQLAEKDNLLGEVSKVLEAVEKRQLELEAENASLREELTKLKREKATAFINDVGNTFVAP